MKSCIFSREFGWSLVLMLSQSCLRSLRSVRDGVLRALRGMETQSSKSLFVFLTLATSDA